MTFIEWLTCANVLNAAERMACSKARGFDVGFLVAVGVLLLVFVGWGLWNIMRIGEREYRKSMRDAEER